jgi:hypothetical protein
LTGTASYEGTNELNYPASLKRPVGKVSVIKSSNRKHTKAVRDNCEQDAVESNWIEEGRNSQ